MSNIYPKFDELYKAIIDDCFEKYSELHKEKDNKSNKKKIDFFYKINALDFQFIDNKNKNFTDITIFSSIYINDIKEFFKDKNRINDEAVYMDYYCVAYLALVGFRANLLKNIENDELFKFQLKNYENYSNFLQRYRLIDQLKEYYDQTLDQIRTSYNSDNNIFSYIIKIFEEQFYNKLIKEKENIKFDTPESLNGTDLTTIEENLENQRKIPGNNDNKFDLNINNINDNTILGENINNNDEIFINDKINNMNKIELQSPGKIDKANKITDERVHNLELFMEKLNNEIIFLKNENYSLNKNRLKSDFEIIKVKYK